LHPLAAVLTGVDKSFCLQTLAQAHYYKGEFSVARDYLGRIAGDYGDYDEVLFYQGLSVLNLGLDPGPQVEKLRRDYPDKPYAGILAAEKSRLAGAYPEALAVLEDTWAAGSRLNAVEENLVRAYRANVYLDMQQYDSAYDLYHEIITVDPDAWFAWQQIYAMQVAAGDLDNAQAIRDMLVSRGVVVTHPAR
jgi:tetratricopeptide (TPR) repeat protein